MIKQNWYLLGRQVLVSCAMAFTTAFSAHAATYEQGPSGGPGGGGFTDTVPPAGYYINAVDLGYRDVINQMTVRWTNGASTKTASHGRPCAVVGCAHPRWSLPSTQKRLTRIWGYADTYVNTISFCTSFYECSGRYGRNIGKYFTYGNPD